jgi:hypothetical protein
MGIEEEVISLTPAVCSAADLFLLALLALVVVEAS